MASVMDIAREELSRHGASRLLLLRIRYGVLDQVQPEAMRMAFEAMTVWILAMFLLTSLILLVLSS